MNKEALLAELNRLLDLGEPLLTVFPKLDPALFRLELPDNTSPAMRWYAYDVAWRAADREKYQGALRSYSTDFLAGWVEEFEVGLLGWRAIGVLK